MLRGRAPYRWEASSLVYSLSLAEGGVQMPLHSAAPYGSTLSYYWAQGRWEQNKLYQPNYDIKREPLIAGEKHRKLSEYNK